jgi:mRNA-degrading endonuclease RelE of RelBE toxin-antitoxin system
MSIKVVESAKFAKDIKNLKKRYRAIEADIEPLTAQLEAGETPGDMVTGNKYPVYKVRVKNSDIKKGQSGRKRSIHPKGFGSWALPTLLVVRLIEKQCRGNLEKLT